jgi:5-methylcytosine-specific restriction protein A
MPIRPEPKKNKNLINPNKSWSGTKFDYSSKDWIKLRNFVRSEEPLCRICKDRGEIVPTKIIDHIKPIIECGEAWDRDNLQGLCESCHNRKSAIEKNKRT